MGELHYCLGITIRQDKAKKAIEMQQKQYILKMLKKYRLQKSKPVSTPADPNVKLRKDDNVSKAVDPVMNQSMVEPCCMWPLQQDLISLKQLELCRSSAQSHQKLT